ncbi:MAG: hypothetical protein ACD_62C00166G0003 [uncultured bacterium]|nr:MAG: hypothetical protein ACD_62C00166G0003 [uncultured bacterium]HLD44412.1 tetratricopeptide repeat protein [bacterium]
MDDKQLEKVLTSKSFLKRNEFAEVVAKTSAYCRENKKTVTWAVTVLVILGLFFPVFNWYRLKTVQDFNQALYQAEKSVQKIDKYKELLNKFEKLPAAQLVRLKLAQALVDHKNDDEAITVLKEGLGKGQDELLNTLLVLKSVGLLKEKGRFEEASSFAAQNESLIIKPFLGQYKLLQGDLLVLADKKAEARKLYEFIVGQTSGMNKEKAELSGYDPRVIDVAKDKLLVLDLNAL